MPTSATVTNAAADRSATGAFAVLDVETTGLTRDDRVVQIAIADVDGEGNLLDYWSSVIDPGRDPGPIDIHGVTPDRLAGAPTFADVAPEISARLQGRVLVAHNAAFDARMVRAEFNRLGLADPVQTRLCTIALARRLDLAVPDFKLATITDHFGVVNRRAHDALSDVLATTEVLAQLLAASHRVRLALPLARHSDVALNRASGSRPVPFRNPGRWAPGHPLVQGMTVAISGPTRLRRRDLVQRGFECGVATRRYLGESLSLLIANETTRRVQAARVRGLAVIDEEHYLALLDTVGAGITREEAPGERLGRGQSPPQPVAPALIGVSGLLSGRRVLVLGDDAAAAQTRADLTARGAVVRAELTEAVTDVVVLPSGQDDPRCEAADRLGVPRLDPDWPHQGTANAGAGFHGTAPAILPAGWRVSVPNQLTELRLLCRWSADDAVDVTACLQGGAPHADDLVDAGHRSADDGTLTITTETEGEATLAFSLASVSESVDAILVEARVTAGAIPVELRFSDRYGRDLGRAICTVTGESSGSVLCRLDRGHHGWQLQIGPAFGRVADHMAQ